MWFKLHFEVVLSILFSISLLVLLLIVSSGQVLQYADSADLFLAATHRGLAHSPGYPLYTLLLSFFISICWFAPQTISAGWLSSLLVAIASGMLFYMLIMVHKKLIKNTRVSYDLIAAIVLLWTVIPLNWKLSQVVEIMPLSLVMTLMLCLHALPVKKNMIFIGLWGALAGLYHPLLLGLVGWIFLVCLWLLRKHLVLAVRNLVIGVFLGAGLTALAYLLVSLKPDSYGWEIPQNVLQWWHFWSRQVYTADGSQIELFSRDIRPLYLLQACWLWLKWWLVEQYGVMWTIFGMLGFALLVFKKQWAPFFLLLVPLLLYGPLLSMYLKHPLSYSLPEVGLWWGIALRERMFYVWALLAVFPSAIGVFFLRQYVKEIVFVLLVILCCWRATYQVNYGSIGSGNSTQLYSERLLTSLPFKSVIIIDSDIVFDLLYTQSNLHTREDIVIIPIGMVLRQAWWRINQRDYSHFGFSGNKQEYIVDLVVTSLSHDRRVFLYGVEAQTLEYLGLEGNPFYGVPFGYSLEVKKVPEHKVESYDYGISAQLAAMKSDKSDSWFKGFRAHLGTIHAQNAYYLARLGYVSESEWHSDIAEKMFYRSESSGMVKQSLQVGKERYQTLGSYINYVKQPASYWEAQEPTIYTLSRSVLLQPLNTDLREKLLNFYEKEGNFKEAAYQRKIINLLKE